MDLWVRSQNKEVLIPNPKLSLEKIENEYWIVDLCDDTVLGEYKTKERALEVLDEIQEYMTYDKETGYEYEKFGCYQNCACYKSDILMIYEMPKE